MCKIITKHNKNDSKILIKYFGLILVIIFYARLIKQMKRISNLKEDAI